MNGAVALAASRDPDMELAAALARDLEGNFEALVIAYRERVVSFVARMLRDDERAQDVAQEVFVRAYRALLTYDPQRPVLVGGARAERAGGEACCRKGARA